MTNGGKYTAMGDSLSDADDITEPYIKYLITMMFKTTSSFIKVVCLNNTYNLSLISGAYNDFDFFI